MQSQTKKELSEIKTLVRLTLQAEPQARQDDNLLYYRVTNAIAKQHGDNVAYMSFIEAFLCPPAWLPKFESVVRLRRAVQREDHSLRPPKPVAESREMREADFVEFARQEGAEQW